eukprot:c46744_g1_i1 orf=1-189(-)
MVLSTSPSFHLSRFQLSLSAPCIAIVQPPLLSYSYSTILKSPIKMNLPASKRPNNLHHNSPSP